jgi:spore coat protein CotH
MNVKKETDKEEERRFTLRLSEVESKAIEELKSLLRETTDSAVLRHIINNYKMLYLNHEEAKKKNCQLEKEMNEKNEDLKTLFSVLEKLNPNKNT